MECVVGYPIKTLGQLRPILLAFRKAAGMTQRDVADKLGITQQTYARIEAKPESVGVERLFRILQLLDVELELSPRHPVGSRHETETVVTEVNRHADFSRPAGSASTGAVSLPSKNEATEPQDDLNKPPSGTGNVAGRKATAHKGVSANKKKNEQW